MIVDLFLVYQFVKRLATPFDKWKAYEMGIIDEKGNILKGKDDRRTIAERDAFQKFDLLVLKLKKLLAKVPGGSSRLATFAAALWLIKEHKETDADTLTEEVLEEKLTEYMSLVELNEDVNASFDNFFSEEAPVNSAGGGAIAGIGIGPKGEPGVTKKQANKYKKKNKETKSFSRYINTV
jgi:hypothetical protein